MKEELQVLVVGTGGSMMSRELERMSIQGQIQASQTTINKPGETPMGVQGVNSGKYSGNGGTMSDNKSQTKRAPERMTVPSENDRAVIQKQKSIQERMSMEFQNQLNEADELKIPYRGVVNYPEDWTRRAEIRDREAQAQRQPVGP